MAIAITKADAEWLAELLNIVEANQTDYPELFSKADDETIKIAGQLIRSLKA